ncbi:MAG: globin family protein [Bacteroidota bacterium]
MTPNQIKLVKESWGYVITHSSEAGELFYQHLFEAAPGVRPLFKTDTKEQARKLMAMVTLVVSKLDKLDTIMEDIKGLARRHDTYGAKKEHYAVVGKSLLWTLSKGLGARWTKETEEAWIAAYTVLSGAMIQNQSATKPKEAVV